MYACVCVFMPVMKTLVRATRFNVVCGFSMCRFLFSIYPGLWWGYVIGVTLQNVLYLGFIFRFDWKKESEKAQARAGVISKSCDTDDQNNEEKRECSSVTMKLCTLVNIHTFSITMLYNMITHIRITSTHYS